MNKCGIFSLLLMAGLAVSTAAAYSEEEPVETHAKVRFVYMMCNDIEAIKTFYTDHLGMKETAYMNDESFAYICYDCSGIEFMWFRADNKLPVPEGYASQPGWQGGTVEMTSCSIGIPGEKFAETVKGLIDAGYETCFAKPQWFQDNYWGFPVRDPMGNTIEVFWLPGKDNRPESTEWPD